VVIQSGDLYWLVDVMDERSHELVGNGSTLRVLDATIERIGMPMRGAWAEEILESRLSA